MWASQTVTLDLLQKSVGSPWRNRAVFQKSNLKAPCGVSRFTIDLHKGEYSTCQLLPSTLTFSDVLIGIDLVGFKQSRLTFSKVSRKSMTESGGLPEVQLESTVSFSRFSPDILRAQNDSDVILSIDILWCPDRQRPSETITLDLLQSQSGIAAESYQRNQAQRKILQRSSMKAPCGFFEMPWPSLMSWSALTLSGVRCKLHKQSRLTFSKSQSEVHDGIGRSSRSSTWKHRVLFEVQPWHSQSSKWTYVILSIDILWCPDRQRPSETITLDLLQSQSGIAAESYQRNQAQRKILQRSSMRAPCDFFEMFWPSLMSWSALTLSG